MVFNVGDKVKYDSGDWWFYGTVSAVIENSISPCYRLNVERMEKKNCKFSITQFAFELSLENEVENDLKQTPDVTIKNDLPEVIEQENAIQRIRAISGAWGRNLELYQKGERSNTIYTWITQNRRLFKTNKLSKEKRDKLISIQFPFESVKKEKQKVNPEKVDQSPNLIKDVPEHTKVDAWDKNFELFKKGDDHNRAVKVWITRNRNRYNANKLSEEQLNKLIGVNFPFDVSTQEKPLDNWEKQLRLWKNGSRNPSLQIWRETSVKRFVQGKLPQGKIDKLKEIGILK